MCEAMMLLDFTQQKGGFLEKNLCQV